jgi:hypothetical protein
MEKILIGIPVYDHIEKKVLNALKELPKQMQGYSFETYEPKAANLSAKRNAILRKAKELGVDWLLMQDADIIPTAEDFEVLKAQGEEVIAGAYKNNSTSEWELGTCSDGFSSEVSGKVEEVDFYGAGFLLFSKKFIDRVTNDQDWFYQPLVNGLVVGEDRGFCMKLKDNDIPVLVDTSVQLEHIPRYKNTLLDQVKAEIKKRKTHVEAIQKTMTPDLEVLKTLCELHSITEEEYKQI